MTVMALTGSQKNTESLAGEHHAPGVPLASSVAARNTTPRCGGSSAPGDHPPNRPAALT